MTATLRADRTGNRARLVPAGTFDLAHASSVAAATRECAVRAMRFVAVSRSTSMTSAVQPPFWMSVADAASFSRCYAICAMMPMILSAGIDRAPRGGGAMADAF